MTEDLFSVAYVKCEVLFVLQSDLRDHYNPYTLDILFLMYDRIGYNKCCNLNV